MAKETKRRLGKGLSGLMMSEPVSVTPPAEVSQKSDNTAGGTGGQSPGATKAAKGTKAANAANATKAANVAGDKGAGGSKTAKRDKGGAVPAKSESGLGSSGGDVASRDGLEVSRADQGGGPQHKLNSNGFQYIPTEDVRPNRYQPREEFDDDALDGLAASIRSEGVMQPVVVRRWKEAGNVGKTAQWELVAGERRWRAALLAGLRQLPCVVREVDDQQAAEWALVENLQREDLGAMELAQAFSRLQKIFGMTQDEIAERVGMHRASVANYLRVLELEAPIQQWIQDGSLTFGHAKVLLAMEAGEERVRVARRAVRQGLSVRALGQSAARGGGGSGAQKNESSSKSSDSTQDLERRLGEYFGSRVTIRTSSGGSKGSLQIAFYDLDHFEGLLQKMGYR